MRSLRCSHLEGITPEFVQQKYSRPRTASLNHTWTIMKTAFQYFGLVSRKSHVSFPTLLCSEYLSVKTHSIRFFISSSVHDSAKLSVFKRIRFYLPEDGIYCAAQEAFSCFRWQEFGAEDCHELIEINLSITWHNKKKKDRLLIAGEVLIVAFFASFA